MMIWVNIPFVIMGCTHVYHTLNECSVRTDKTGRKVIIV